MSIPLWKLRPPPLPAPHVSRLHLVQRLAAVKAAVFTAPAGYGKSSLLVESQQAGSGVSAWYRLDPEDRHVERLAVGLGAALGIDAADPARLLERWESHAGPVTLAVDDLHLVADSAAACDLLGELIRCAPPGGRLLLAGRAAPPLPALLRLRLAGQAIEMGSADLVFSEGETRSLASLLGRASARRAPELHQRALGWPAAVAFLAREGDGATVLAEYMATEVMAGLPPDLRETAVALALLPVWDAPACAFMLEGTGLSPDLERLRRQDLPVRAVNGQLEPHPLWLEYLSALLRRSPEQQSRFQRRAALLESARGRPEKALRHALEAGDAGLVEPLLWGLLPRLIQTGDLHSLERWLADTPEEMLVVVPDLLLSAGEALRRAGYPRRAIGWLQKAAVGYAAGGRPGELVRAVARLALAHSDLGDWSGALAALRQVEEDLPSSTGGARGEILLATAKESAARGDVERAAERYREAAEQFAQSGEAELAGVALAGLGERALVAGGRLTEALAQLRHAQALLSGSAAADALLAEIQVLALLERWAEAGVLLPGVRPAGPAQWARLNWLRASLAIRRGDMRAAERNGLQGDRFQGEADPTPALACAGMLLQAQLKRGRGDRAGAALAARQAAGLAEAAGTPLLQAEARLLMREGTAVEVPETDARLRVELLGAFRVRCGDGELAPGAWGRARARGVMQYLLLQPGHVAGREAILEAFWPEEDPERSRDTLRVTLHQLRRTLQSVGHDLETTPEQVRLPAAAVASIDLADLRLHLAAARLAVAGSPEACLEHCRVGRALYRGDLLPDVYWPWAEADRRRAQRERIELLQLCQDAAIRLGRTEEAIGALEDLLAQEPGTEQVERQLIALLAATGRRTEAVRRYRDLVRWLKREMGLDPSPETRDLIRALL